MNYLYNDIELPVLPQWDKTVFPYAYIHYQYTTSGGFYSLKLFDTPMESYGIGYGDGTEYSVRTVSGKLAMYTSCVINEEPKFDEPHDISLLVSQKIVWSNYDHFHTDGTLLCAASYPIDPETGEEITIYDPNIRPRPQLNHAALMQGFSTMLSLKK